MSITYRLLEWGQDHVHLFQLLSALVVLGGAGIGWFLRHIKAWYDWKRYKNLESSDRQIVFEAHVLTEMPDGSIRLEVDPWGPKHTLSYVFNDRVLEGEIFRKARARDGMVLLEEPGQFLMMSSLRDAITGNDWTANSDALMGRSVNVDHIAFSPVSWPGVREAHLIRVVITNPAWLERLWDPEVVLRIKAVDPYYRYRKRWLHEIGRAWQRGERGKDPRLSRIWVVPIRSALTAAAASAAHGLKVLEGRAA